MDICSSNESTSQSLKTAATFAGDQDLKEVGVENCGFAALSTRVREENGDKSKSVKSFASKGTPLREHGYIFLQQLVKAISLNLLSIDSIYSID